MAAETLLTASRRVVRFFNIDMQHGGLVSNETQRAIETLHIQVERAAKRDRQIAETPQATELVATLLGEFVSGDDIVAAARTIEALAIDVSRLRARTGAES